MNHSAEREMMKVGSLGKKVSIEEVRAGALRIEKEDEKTYG